MKYTQSHNLALFLGHSFCPGWSLASSLRSWSSARDARPHYCLPTCQPWMRSPHSSDKSCRTAAAGPPHQPLQVACLEVVEVPLPATGLYLVGAPADVSACRYPAWPRSTDCFYKWCASLRFVDPACPRSTSCKPCARAAACCLPGSSRGASARCLSRAGPPTLNSF